MQFCIAEFNYQMVKDLKIFSTCNLSIFYLKWQDFMYVVEVDFEETQDTLPSYSMMAIFVLHKSSRISPLKKSSGLIQDGACVS